jgi:hypothetical protein
MHKQFHLARLGTRPTATPNDLCRLELLAVKVSRCGHNGDGPAASYNTRRNRLSQQSRVHGFFWILTHSNLSFNEEAIIKVNRMTNPRRHTVWKVPMLHSSVCRVKPDLPVVPEAAVSKCHLAEPLVN